MGKYPETARRTPETSPYLNGAAQVFYNHYHSRLAGVAMTRYRWVGLPDEDDQARLESVLCLGGGLAAFTHVEPLEPATLGRANAAASRFAVTRANYGSGELDDMFNPATYTTYAPNGAGGKRFNTNKPLDQWRGVPIWGDSLRQDYDRTTIDLFALRLANASLIVDTNLKATTRGMAIATTQDKLKSTQIAVDTALSGLTLYTGSQELIDSLQAIDLGVHPDTVERSHSVAMRLWNEALTALGVQAGIAEKTERHTDDEVQAIEGAVSAVRKRTLTPRKLAADQINRRYFEGEQVVQVVDQW